VSQQLTPFWTGGQLFWQSWSDVQLETHFCPEEPASGAGAASCFGGGGGG